MKLLVGPCGPAADLGRLIPDNFPNGGIRVGGGVLAGAGDLGPPCPVREINGQAGASFDRNGSTRVRSDGWPIFV